MRIVTGFVCLLVALACFGCRDSASSVATPSTSAVVTPSSDSVVVQQGTKVATVRIEVAATLAARQQGLMFRQELAADAGMLFLFPADVQYGFWMRNTHVPLDIAYISSAGEVLDIKAAKPLDETLLIPSKPYRYVLEVNQGWFERHEMGIGAKVSLPRDLPAAE